MEIKMVQPHTTLLFSINLKKRGGVGGRASRYIYVHRENSIPVLIRGCFFFQDENHTECYIMHSVKPFLMYGSWFQFYEGLLLLSFHKNLCLRNA